MKQQHRTVRADCMEAVSARWSEESLVHLLIAAAGSGRRMGAECNKLLLPLAGSRCVLLEPPFESLPLHWEQILFEVAGRGFKILIAHPERCAQLAQQPMLVERLLETGVYLQVNWTSLLGYHGKLVQKTAHHLARSGAIHCMATDSHNTRERSALIVRRGAEELAALVGRKNLALLTVENPARVLNGNGMQNIDMTALPQLRRGKPAGWSLFRDWFGLRRG